MAFLIIDETKMIVLNTGNDQKYKICDPCLTKKGERFVSLQGMSESCDIDEIIGLTEEIEKTLFPEYFI